MIFSSVNAGKKGKGSPGVAILFLAIAVVGIWLSLSSVGNKPVIPAAGDSVSVTSPSYKQAQQSYSNYMLRVILVTVAMVVVIMISAKWYRAKMKPVSTGNANIRLLGRHYISPKHTLVLIQVEDKKLLLGMTDSSINLITELKADEALEPAPLQPSDNGDVFRAIYNKFRNNNS